MPAPILHIALSLLMLPFLPGKNHREFILGASFPDIRYLGVIERRVSHKAHPSWHSIEKEQSSFRAGMEFHALVDVMHDEYMARRNVYGLLPGECRKSPNYLKFFEDMLIYHTIENTMWRSIAGYFDEILKEELALVQNIDAIKIWHSHIKQYICIPPTKHSIQNLLNVELPTWYGMFAKIPIKANACYISSVFARNVPKLVTDKRLCAYIFEFYNQFSQYLGIQENTHIECSLKRPFIASKVVAAYNNG